MDFIDLQNYVIVMWSGDLDDDRLLVQFCRDCDWMTPLKCRGAFSLNKDWTKIYTSDPERGYQVCFLALDKILREFLANL